MTFNIDGTKKKILVFLVSDIKPLSLSDLAMKESIKMVSQIPSKNLSEIKRGHYDGGGVRVSDKVANGIIYTAAAIMLGSEIKNLILKK